MKREEFKKVIKIMSFWKVDKRRRNYKLPNGERLEKYLESLVIKFLKNNSLAFDSKGDIQENTEGVMFIPFAENEKVCMVEQWERTYKFIAELLY